MPYAFNDDKSKYDLYDLLLSDIKEEQGEYDYSSITGIGALYFNGYTTGKVLLEYEIQIGSSTVASGTHIFDHNNPDSIVYSGTTEGHEYTLTGTYIPDKATVAYQEFNGYPPFVCNGYVKIIVTCDAQLTNVPKLVGTFKYREPPFIIYRTRMLTIPAQNTSNSTIDLYEFTGVVSIGGDSTIPTGYQPVDVLNYHMAYKSSGVSGNQVWLTGCYLEYGANWGPSYEGIRWQLRYEGYTKTGVSMSDCQLEANILLVREDLFRTAGRLV